MIQLQKTLITLTQAQCQVGMIRLHIIRFSSSCMIKRLYHNEAQLTSKICENTASLFDAMALIHLMACLACLGFPILAVVCSIGSNFLGNEKIMNYTPLNLKFHQDMTEIMVYAFFYKIFAWFCDNIPQSIFSYEPLHNKSNKMTYAPSEDSVFPVSMKKPCVLSHPMSAQRRLRSDWAHVQTCLSLCVPFLFVLSCCGSYLMVLLSQFFTFKELL